MLIGMVVPGESSQADLLDRAVSVELEVSVLGWDCSGISYVERMGEGLES